MLQLMKYTKVTWRFSFFFSNRVKEGKLRVTHIFLPVRPPSTGLPIATREIPEMVEKWPSGHDTTSSSLGTLPHMTYS